LGLGLDQVKGWVAWAGRQLASRLSRVRAPARVRLTRACRRVGAYMGGRCVPGVRALPTRACARAHGRVYAGEGGGGGADRRPVRDGSLSI